MMRRIFTWTVIAIVLAVAAFGAVYSLREYPRVSFEDIEPESRRPATPPNFSRSGVAAKNLPGLIPDRLYLVYEEVGAPAKSVLLEFDEWSFCGGETQRILCMAMSVSDYGLANGRKISVIGTLEGKSLRVQELTMEPASGEPAP